MLKQEFKKTVKIYKSHKLANNFISVTFAYVKGKNSVSVERTEVLEDKGGALTSLYFDRTGKK